VPGSPCGAPASEANQTGEPQVIRTIIKLLVVAAAGVFLAANWQDIRRYLAIRQVSSSPHPEMIPARGRTRYPNSHAAGAPDGTGDFDAAQRGGPVLA
jgi:uncharacterized protein DUF6893